MINCATNYRILKLLKEKKYAYREYSRTDPMYYLRVHFVQSVYLTRVISALKKKVTVLEHRKIKHFKAWS